MKRIGENPKSIEELLAILREKRCNAEWKLKQNRDTTSPGFYSALRAASLFDYFISLTLQLQANLEGKGKTDKEGLYKEEQAPRPSYKRLILIGVGLWLLMAWIDPRIVFFALIGTFIGTYIWHRRAMKKYKEGLEKEKKEPDQFKKIIEEIDEKMGKQQTERRRFRR